jgi:nucleoside-diphosphate-sugar epimerase
MRPVRDQTVLVTGATDGLGKALATELARVGATVIVHGRDNNRGKAALAGITKATGNDRLHWYQADLAHLDQVRDLAAAVAAALSARDRNPAPIELEIPPGARASAQQTAFLQADQLGAARPAERADGRMDRPGVGSAGQAWPSSVRRRPR